MDDFCVIKSIRREFSVAKTPQQNGIAKRRNQTLTEAARTMLGDSKLPTTFWAAVNTACYVQNRSDDGFFVEYSLNIKAFRVYNIRTRKVEENLHIRFLENKPIIAGTKETIGAGYASKVTGTSKDYILMPLWKDGSLFGSSSKNANNDEPQPSSDAGKKDDDVTTALLEATHADLFGDETKVDMSNISTTYLVLSTPNTRIHKDHSLDHVISDVMSGVQTMRMTKTTSKQGFISGVYEGKTHKDLHTCLFACFLSQEEPKKAVLSLCLIQRICCVPNRCKECIGKIEEEVYVRQPLGFENPEFPDRVYKVEKALYSLHQAPRAWYETLSTYLLDNGSYRGLQVTQKDDGIFISQNKYMDEVLKKFGFLTVKTASTPIETSKPLLKDAKAEDKLTGSEGFQEIVDFLNGSHIRYVLTKNPTIFVSLIEQFWQTAVVKTVDNGEQEITATVDGKEFIVTETSVRIHLQLADADDEAIYKEWDDIVERAITIAASLDAKQASGNINRTQSTAMPNVPLP
nr:putative ribonuclease H-like domain-containing protein [Tanacetum cinerariifolium]